MSILRKPSTALRTSAIIIAGGRPLLLPVESPKPHRSSRAHLANVKEEPDWGGDEDGIPEEEGEDEAYYQDEQDDEADGARGLSAGLLLG